jgi:3-deoxy-D-manno-octulosonic-acid transferase
MTRFVAWALNFAYLLLLVLASPWILWSAIKHNKYREGFGEKFLGRVPRRTSDRPCIWLHAVSVGEVNLLATTIAELASRLPEFEVVISTTTKSGYDLARRKYAERVVFYCPLDFSWAVAQAMRRVRPTMLILAELELWPNLIAAAKRYGSRVTIINGRLSDNSFRGYRRLRMVVGYVLRQIDIVAAQSEETATRFRKLGGHPDAIRATGSLKFDGAQTDRDNPRTRQLQDLVGLSDQDVVLLAGSTQELEEQYAVSIYKRLAPHHPNLKLIVVPRHAERFDEVAGLLKSSGLLWQRRSSYNDHGGNSASATANHNKWSALLIDTIGELNAWWGTANIGFVGGSFGSRGGQNMLEPAAYGVATCFGPNTWNFRDIVGQLLSAGGAEVVQDKEQLESFVRRMLECPAEAAALGDRAQRFVLTQQGATRRTVELLCNSLPKIRPIERDRRDEAA